MKHRKLAAHIHSDFSDDCDWPLDRIVRRLRWMGYDGAMVCEHDRTMTESKWRAIIRTCAKFTRSGFLIVPGIEYQDPSHTIHMPVYGEAPFVGPSPDIPQLLAHAREHDAVSVFAHPTRRSAHDHFDQAWFADLVAIEVWNRKYDGIRPNSWALEAAARHGVARFTALDFHGPRQLFPLSLQVPDRTGMSAADCVAAILAGKSIAGAIGSTPDRLDTGGGARLLDRLEQARTMLAPRIRRVEQVFGRGTGGG
jgi:predicted metal-dependent phosphoesterase TrpH